jgi:hypothetical protein
MMERASVQPQKLRGVADLNALIFSKLQIFVAKLLGSARALMS